MDTLGRVGSSDELRLESLISASQGDDLDDATLPELRAGRELLQQAEEGLSYVRRIAQGRLDTVRTELGRRNDPEARTSSELGPLVDGLTEALSCGGRSMGEPRPPREFDPPGWVDDLLRDLDQLVSPAVLAKLSGHGDRELEDSAEDLAVFERRVSDVRLRVQARADRLQGQLVLRYQGGETVDGLLRWKSC